MQSVQDDNALELNLKKLAAGRIDTVIEDAAVFNNKAKALGLYGIERVQQHGQDDHLSWLLIPLLGFTFAGCALRAILYALTPPERWNARFNPGTEPDTPAGHTHWGTIGAIVASLMVGTGVLMASLAFSFQRYFEYQIEDARKISQPSQAPIEK